MENTLFASTCFNAPHFIELQLKTFNKFVEDKFAFVVIDDSTDTTRSILSGNLAKPEIKTECDRLGIRCINVPQSIHNFEDQGGLVIRHPNTNLNHPTERHQSLLRYIFNNNKSLGFNQYKTFALMDADMFFKKPINVSKYMEGIDMLGSHRDQVLHFPEEMKRYLPERTQKLDGIKIDFFTLCILWINMQTVNNLEKLDNSSFRSVTDTGGKTYFFMQDNPQYKYFFLQDCNSPEYRVDFFAKENVGANESEGAEFLHYRAGSNWSHENVGYYRAKLNKMLEKYLPEFATNEVLSEDVISANKEHIIKTDGTIISRYGV